MISLEFIIYSLYNGRDSETLKLLENLRNALLHSEAVSSCQLLIGVALTALLACSFYC